MFRFEKKTFRSKIGTKNMIWSLRFLNFYIFADFGKSKAALWLALAFMCQKHFVKISEMFQLYSN
jgi:hypothetical protein